MKTCVVTGRILPERADVRFDPITYRVDIGDGAAEVTAHVERSLLSALVKFDHDIENFYYVGSVVRQVAGGGLSDYIGFNLQASYSIIIDQFVDIDTGFKHVVPVFEPMFESQQESQTFVPGTEDKPIPINVQLMADNFVRRLLNEATNALRRPEFSAMYCRLAIETIRSSFQENSADEAAAWEKLRGQLNVGRSTLDSFWKLAAEQRHGKIVPLTSAQRREMLQITWEVANRFLLAKEAILVGREPPTFLKL